MLDPVPQAMIQRTNLPGTAAEASPGHAMEVVGTPAATVVRDTYPSRNPLFYEVATPDRFASPLIMIKCFAPVRPQPGEEDWYAYYQETLVECAGEPDLILRKAAVDASRIYEPAIWEAARAADIIIAYEHFWEGRFVVSGNRAWASVVRGQVDKPTIILPLYACLEDARSFDALVEAGRAAKGTCTCQICEPDPVSRLPSAATRPLAPAEG